MKCDHDSFYSDSVYRCLKCEGHEREAAEAALFAADALAKAARNLDTEINVTDELTWATCVRFKIALAAYEAVRGTNDPII